MTQTVPAGTPASRPASASDVVSAVRDMYARHPFPSSQRRHGYRRHAAFVRRFLEERGIDPRGKRFGDIACGTGLMMLDYAREFPETTFVGYDLSPASVNLANETMAQEGITNAAAQVQDITALEVEDEFDYILSWGTIHHLPDPREGLGIICRALKPGGILRTGIYGFHGNWERRVQQEIIRTVTEEGPEHDRARIEAVRIWAQGDRNFKNYYTAPPVDLDDDDWVVDEFLHVWEQHLALRDVVSWLGELGMQVHRLTDYYDQEISLDIARHSTSPGFVAMVEKLPFEDRCHVIDMIVRPYWLSLLAEKTGR